MRKSRLMLAVGGVGIALALGGQLDGRGRRAPEKPAGRSPMDLAAAERFCLGQLPIEQAAYDFLPDTTPLRRYFQCRALATGDPVSACRPLRFNGRPGSEERDRYCRDNYEEAQEEQALITRSPRFVEACQQTHQEPPPPGWRDLIQGSPKFMAKLCRLIGENQAHPERICAKAVAMGRSAGIKYQCASRDFMLMFGLERDCSTIPILPGERPWQIEDCRTWAAFKKAHEGRDPELCGELPICRVMMGAGAESCRPYADRVRSEFCSRHGW